MKRKPYQSTIFRKILLSMLAIVLIQSALIYGVIIYGGTLVELENNSFDIFGEKVVSRKNNLENEMLQRWSELSAAVDTAEKLAEEFAAENRTDVLSMTADQTQSEIFLTTYAEELINLIRRNTVSGTFIVLDSKNDTRKNGLYLRDYDPSTSSSDHSDLLVLRGSSAVTKKINISLDSLWQPKFTLTADNSFFYTKPFEAALTFGTLEWKDLGYWSSPFRMDGENPNDTIDMITYSVPLRTEKGVPFGVLGIEISSDYLKKQLPAGELHSENRGSYLIAQGTVDSDVYRSFIRSGSALSTMLDATKQIEFQSEPNHKNFYSFGTENLPFASDEGKIYGAVQSLTLYNTNTPFENDKWVLIGIISENYLLEFSHHFQQILIITWIASFLIGAVVIAGTARMITKPISTLTQKLKKADPNVRIELEPVHIAEIDKLSDSIQSLSMQVMESAQRLSKIMELTSVEMAAFEYDAKKKMIFCTKQFFSILNRPDLGTSDKYIASEAFRSIFDSLEGEAEDDSGTSILYSIDAHEQTRWVRLKLAADNIQTLGVVIDVTQEICEKRQLEHDRNYDLLTNLLNRRAFYEQMQKLFSSPQLLRTAAVVMMDLDDLKFVNDTYGHDYGDEYIRSAAAAIRRGAGESSVISRISGDEFVFLLYGFSTQEQIRAICMQIKTALQKSLLYLPDGSSMQIRASAGIAWYPQDSADYDELVRYADFTMYMVKKTNKGRFDEFSIEDYNNKAYLLQCREELNMLLEHSMVDYYFQPIVDACTGEIFGFEALMRPDTPNIRTPDKLLSLARSQSKLSEVERLTMFEAIRSFGNQNGFESGVCLFINSISNQLLSDDDAKLLEQKYGSVLHHIVLELTEEECNDSSVTRRKRIYAARWKAQIALDDYGIGYNGDAVLLEIKPDYIKLDMSLVRDVHQDENKRVLIENILSYCKDRGIRVIAEGIEKREEMEALILAGVDYLQGYYLGRPLPTVPTAQERIHCRAEIRKIAGVKES
ncbi:MAG: EAL domain-containing protein [Clostridia bacterium]